MYSYSPKGKFAIGLGVQASQFPKGKVNGTNQFDAAVASFLDFRYYYKPSEKNILFPIFQGGYSLYSNFNHYGDADITVNSSISSIAQFSIGAGYRQSGFEKWPRAAVGTKI